MWHCTLKLSTVMDSYKKLAKQLEYVTIRTHLLTTYYINPMITIQSPEQY